MFVNFYRFYMKKLLVLLSLTAIILTACGGGSKEEPQEGAAKMTAQESQELLAKAKGIFVGPLPDKMPGSENDTPEMIALGEKLYHETKLSKGGNQSCNTCHDLNNAGQDSKPVSEGSMPGKIGRRNSNTVLNAGFQFAQFWDYRAADLVEQAKGPILNPDEMAMPSEKEVEKVISAVPEYVEMFAKAFPADKKPITYHNLARAIAAFERTLISKSRSLKRYVNQNNVNKIDINFSEFSGKLRKIEARDSVFNGRFQFLIGS